MYGDTKLLKNDSLILFWGSYQLLNKIIIKVKVLDKIIEPIA
jgi:hypothetical protein